MPQNMRKNIFYDITIIVFYSCFPVIYLFSFNYDKYLSNQYEYFNVLTTCLFSSVTFLVAYATIGIITKKHARFISILLVFFIFNYGDLYNVLENLFTITIKTQYFLIIYILFFTIIYLSLKRVNRTQLILFCLLIYIVPVFSAIKYYAQHNNYNVNSSFTKYDNDNYTKRDVYYIILDGFINLVSYKDKFPDRYNDFKTRLDDLGMTILDKTWSAYPNTVYSIPSTLNLNYIYNYNYIKPDSVEFDKLQFYHGSNNIVYKTFDSLNYKIIINSNIWRNPENIVYDYLECARMSEFQEVLFDNSIVNIFEYYLIKYFDIQIKSSRFNEILCQFNNIKKSEYTAYPKFMFSHIYCPHPPYVFNNDGEKINSSSTSSNWKPEKEYYGQLEFCSKLLVSTLESLLKNYENQLKPIIIIQSDHGAHLLDATLDFKNISQHLRILNLQYLPGQKISLEEEININTFRKIFNHYYGMNYDYLQKHVFVTNTYLGNEQELKFINVDSLIDGAL
jgi:hypothetical protein